MENTGIAKVSPHGSAVIAPDAGAAMILRPAMSRWTDEELRELVTLWPTNSASQIAKQLRRRRSAICRKAERLWQEGLLPHNPAQDFDVYPSKRRPAESMP